MIIRDARPDEYSVVGELRVVAYRALGLLPEGSGYAETLRGFGFGGDCVVLVAADEAGSSILGTTTLEPFGPASELARDETEADVRAFAVAPRAQGQGVGRKLLLAVIERAEKRRLCRLRLCTRPAMKAAQHLYATTGFSRTPDLDFEPVPGLTLRAYELALPLSPFPGHEPDICARKKRGRSLRCACQSIALRTSWRVVAMDSDAPSPLSAEIDTTVPASARIWNYWLGGKDFYPVDKQAGDQFAQFFPGIFDMARESRYFIARVVRYLAGEAGIRQFLDIGTGLPSHDSTYEIAHRAAPGSRVVYVDSDPFVLAHARARHASSTGGGTDYINADLNDPGALLRAARGELDFGRPAAIMLMGILGHIGNPEDDDDRAAQSVVGTLRAALPPGGYLAIYDTSDTDPGQNAALRDYNDSGAAPYRVRRPDQIVRFFDGLQMVDPGVVPIQQWRPDDTPSRPPGGLINMGGVGRKALCRPSCALPKRRSPNLCSHRSHGEAAHGEFAEPVPEADAELILTVMGEVLEEIYQSPARVARRRAACLNKDTGN